MTTALAIITDSLQRLGVVSMGQQVPANYAVVALNTLNEVIDAWALQNLYAITVDEQVYTMPPGTGAVTIGPGQMISVQRPVQIEGAYMRKGNQDYQIEPIERETWEAIQNKGIQAYTPDFVFYNGGATYGTLHFYPVMSGYGDLHLSIQTQVTQFVDLNTNYALAQGYKRAFVMTLAEELQDVFGRQLNPAFLKRAAQTRKQLRKSNLSPVLTETPQPVRWNIYSNR